MSSLDALLMTLTTPQTLPSPVRVSLRPSLVRGLSFLEILDLAARHPDARETVLRMFGLSLTKSTASAGKADMLAIVDTLLTALDRRGTWGTLMLSRASSDAIVSLLTSVVSLTHPSDVAELFKPTESDEGSSQSDGGAWEEPAVAITKLAVRLEGAGFRDVMNWTLGRILFAGSVDVERDAERAKRDLVYSACATRASKYKDSDWKAFISEQKGG